MSSVDEIDDADFQLIFRTFQAESNDRLVEMEEQLLRLETRPDDEEAIQAIFRGAHTIKGNSESLGLVGTTRLSHVMEDVLHRLRTNTLKATPPLVSLMLRTVDALRGSIAEGCAGRPDELPVMPGLVDELRAVKESAPLAAAKPAAAETPPPPVPVALPADWPADPPAQADPGAQPSSDAEAPVESPTPGESSAPAESAAAAEVSSDSGGNSHSSGEARSLRVEMDRIDRMVNLSGEIVIAQAHMRDLLASDDTDKASLRELHRVTDNLCRALQEQVMRLRMVPVGPFFRRFVRVVRDLARKVSKSARLVIEGADVEIDTALVDHLKDPVTHMIRNSVDHGIEPPDVREAAGKHRCGVVTLRAFQDGGSVVIQVSDDGGGFKRQRIYEKAVQHGLVAEGERVRDEDLLRCVLRPGFSTADTVTDISGRGVGMDVVARNIQLLGGTLSIESTEGQGTTLTARVPLTLAIIEGLLVGIGDDRYIIPLDLVEECLEIEESESDRKRACGLVKRHDRLLPFIRLRHFFQLGSRSPARESVVILRWLGGHVGLAVDTLLGENRTVVKPLGKLLKGVRGFAAATLLGDGQVALILDVGHIVQTSEQRQRLTGSHSSLDGVDPTAAR